MRREPFRQQGGRGRRPLQPHVQRPHPAQHEPRLHRPGDRTVQRPVRVQPPHQVRALRRHHGRAQQHVRVPGEVLRGGVHHHVHPPLERPLCHRGGERVVDRHHRPPLLPCQAGQDRGDVGHLHHRVGRGLEEEQVGAGGRGDDRGDVVGLHGPHGERARGRPFGEQRGGAVVGVAWHHHDAAHRHQGDDGGDRPHPGRVGERVPALQCAENLLEGLPRGVGDAGVVDRRAGEVGGGERDRRVHRRAGGSLRPAEGDGAGGGGEVHAAHGTGENSSSRTRSPAPGAPSP